MRSICASRYRDFFPRTIGEEGGRTPICKHRARITEPAAQCGVPANQFDALPGIVFANQNFGHVGLGSHFIPMSTSSQRCNRRAVFVSNSRFSLRRNCIFSTGFICFTVRIIASPSCSVVKCIGGALCLAILRARAPFSALVIRPPSLPDVSRYALLPIF